MNGSDLGHVTRDENQKRENVNKLKSKKQIKDQIFLKTH